MSAATGIEIGFRGQVGAFPLDAGFASPARGVTALFGPSGCGKTTLLRCIAGLQRLEGTCVVAGEVWQDARRFLAPHRRPIGYVFQEASLFPHLSVRRNLLYGHGRGGANGIRWDEIVDLLMLERLLDRAPRHLSGGERQRVALGRALLTNPALVLMDEPLAALDRQARDEVLTLLESLRDRLTLPMIYVTHDLAEVERLADRLVLMRAGRVLAAGPLAELQSDPALPLAAARDAAVTMDGVIERCESAYGLVRIVVAGVPFLVPGAPGPIGAARRLRIAAADVSLSREPGHGSTILNILPVQIVSASLAGEHEMVAVLSLGAGGDGPNRLLARITRLSWERLALAQGMRVYAQVKSVALARRGDVHDPADSDQAATGTQKGA